MPHPGAVGVWPLLKALPAARPSLSLTHTMLLSRCIFPSGLLNTSTLVLAPLCPLPGLNMWAPVPALQVGRPTWNIVVAIVNGFVLHPVLILIR